LESGKIDCAGERDLRRKLAVILASDVAGYSRLVAADEEDTVLRFRRAAAAFGEQVRKYRGRVFNTAGDAILVEFESAVDATRCALDIQNTNNAHNAAIDPSKRLLFRIGIAIGDVLVCDNGDLLGDGVNIAARLEGIAEPGAICISDEVKVHAASKISAVVLNLGERTLKNIPRAIRVHQVGALGKNTFIPTPRPQRKVAAGLWAGGVVAALFAASGAFLVIQYVPPSPPAAVSRPAIESASAGIAHRFDAARVPLVTDRARSSLADYAEQPDFKAIAISLIGWGVSSGFADSVGAERDALERCRRRDPKGDCRIYAVGDQVVWPPQPAPLAADFHPAPLDVPLDPADYAIIKGMPSAAGLEAFLRGRDHKALAVSAVSDARFSSMVDRADRAEAIRLAVERCSDAAKSPCLLISVDGLLTVRIPRSHGIVRPYTVSGETEMSKIDKERIAKIYSGEDWRALAQGASGRWYAVSAVETENAAAERALQECRHAESDCVLRTIGNFRIDLRAR
jgi:class 3 adenylate cyclase